MKLKNLSNDDLKIHNEKVNLWEMSNLHPEDTGILSIVIWLGSGVGKKHRSNIKVCIGTKWNKNQCSTIPLFGKKRIIGNTKISQNQFDQINRWIDLNRNVILKYSNNEITTREMLSLIQRI